MKTKRIIFTITLFTLLQNTHAVTINEVYTKTNSLEQKLQSESSARIRLQEELNDAKVIISEQKTVIDSLKNEVKLNSDAINKTEEQLRGKIDKTNENLTTKADESEVKSKTLWGIIAMTILILIGLLTYFLLHKRIKTGNANVEALKEKAEKINEDILNQLSLEIVEMQKISQSLKTLSESSEQNGNKSETDHSLIKTLADRITFMEMTLYRMDPKVRGYNQLSRSIQQMKDNFLANGYEIVDMLGKPYHDGMKVIANFKEDDNLEPGSQIITGIIKPQINYNGEMIQAAQITVSQN